MIEIGSHEKPKVLIVDDETEVLNSLADLLRKDFHIFATSDVDEAQALLVAHDVFSLVISDQRMPVLTGAEFLGRVEKISPDTARILLTGYADIDAVIEAVNQGHIVQYITKPWDAVKLLELLKPIAERHHLLKENRRLIRQLAQLNQFTLDSSARIETLEETRSTLQNDNKTLKASYDQIDKAFKDLKRNEEALRKSEELFRSLTQLSPVGIFRTDAAGAYVYVNQRWCEITGMDVSGAIGQGWVRGICSEERESVMANWKGLIQEHGTFNIEHRFRMMDGSLTWVLGQAIAEIGADGEIIGYIGSITDISTQKGLEAKIKALLAEKELLLHEVHHRIKNNMSVIMSLLSLQSGVLGDNPAAVAALEDSRSRVQAMMVLYDKLYRSSDFREISTKEYLTSLITEIIDNFSNCGLVTIETNIGDFILDAKTLSPIGMILNELLTNAMKHAFIGRENGVIAVSLSVKNDHATLLVKDNGVGIPESFDIATSTGFGMQLVGMLAGQLDGAIRLERDNGSRFILEFDV